ncbi:MAG: agmatinase family protein [Planctomycetes bacterium]|nr:agmatinase family protein [Planctomycetota bacterium]
MTEPLGIYGLEPTDPAEAAVVLIPVPFEATTSYGRGTAQGPRAIFEASPQIDLFDLEVGSPADAGIALLPEDSRVHAWNARACELAGPVIAAEGAGDDPALLAATAEVNRIGAELNDWLEAEASVWLERGALVGVLGGDHSTPLGAIRALAKRHPGLGVLHVDAHADQRDAYMGFRYSHASILHNVLAEAPGVAAVVGVGYRDLCREEHAVLEADPRCAAYYEPLLRQRQLAGATWSELVGEAVANLPPKVYVSFDIDGLDPTLCPNTGTPVPGGLSFAEACALLREVVSSGREIVGFDLCEVAPDPRGESEWDGNVGMRVLYKLAGFALASRQPG